MKSNEISELEMLAEVSNNQYVCLKGKIVLMLARRRENDRGRHSTISVYHYDANNCIARESYLKPSYFSSTLILAILARGLVIAKFSRL